VPNSVIRIFIILLAGVALTSSAFPSETITPQGVGLVKLGATYTDLRAKGLVGPISGVCSEMAGPDSQGARLLPPLKGSVGFTFSKPRRVDTITIEGGATARGIGVGATSQALKTAFPAAKFDHSSEQVFGLTFVNVPRGKGGPIAFAVSTKSKRVQEVGVPGVPVCD
jgi:hypothetical protein